MKGSPVTLLVAGTLLLYPFVVYLAAGRVPAAVLVAGILTALALRLALVAGSGRAPRLLWLAVAGLLLLALASLANQERLSVAEVRLYPVLVDGLFFALFFASLFTRQPLVERIARAMEGGELAPQAVTYTRHVTWVWSAALLLNTLIAAYTTWWTSLAAWAFYNGLLSYLLIGGLFAAEYLIRLRRQREWRAA